MLVCENLHYCFRPGQEVLRKISWDFAPGEVTAILGPNGAGKTTFLRLLLGILDPSHGNVLLHGKRVSSIDPRDLARSISYVPQRGGTEFAFTVRQVLELGLAKAGFSSLIERVAGELSLTELLSRRANELSEGQRQRVTLARAIVQIESSPLPASDKMVLADEPFSAMDPRQERQSMRVLQGMARGGCSIVVVMHDLRAASRLANQAILLDENGRMKASGSIGTVLAPENIEAVFGIVE